MIDTHVHLDHQKYELSPPELTELKAVVQICTDIKINSKIKLLLEQHQGMIFCAVGIHPVDVKKFVLEDVGILYKTAKTENVVAIGEIGLDYHWYPEEKKRQLLFLKAQLNVALELSLPVIIHARDAYEDVISVLSCEEFSNLEGVIHSFSGDVEQAKAFINLGFLIGITGPVTFKNGKNQQKVVENIELKYILAETDSPYLSPVPKRGELNEPKNVRYVIEKIAELKKISIEDCVATLDKNAEKLFNLGVS
jgi:TatD DNase family protein